MNPYFLLLQTLISTIACDLYCARNTAYRVLVLPVKFFFALTFMRIKHQISRAILKLYFWSL